MGSGRVTAEAIELPFIKEDFETGTRVYRYITATDNAVFGTVVKVNDDSVEVRIDNRPKQILKARLKDFRSHEGADAVWGKALPMKELHIGCHISITTFGHKTTAIVTAVSDDAITIYYNQDPKIVNTYRNSKDLSLEAQLMFWEIEG